jgi:hypothetical protein
MVDDTLFIQQDRKLLDQLLLAAIEHRNMLDLHGRPVGSSGEFRRFPLGFLEPLNTFREPVQVLSKQPGDVDTRPIEESPCQRTCSCESVAYHVMPSRSQDW